MKTKISHLGRSTVSVILAVMMLLSTMLVGTVSTANAVDLTKFSKVYLDAKVAKYDANTDMLSTKPSNAYAFKGNSSQETYTDETSPTAGKDWPGGSLKSEGNNIYSILVSNDAAKIIFNSGKDGKKTGDLTLPPNWKTTPMIYCGDGSEGSYGWGEYSASVDPTGVVTDTRLISVLDGSKVMFYGGEYVNWNQNTFYAMTSNDTNTAVDNASMSPKKTISNTEYEFALLCVPKGNYFLGHWASGLSTTVSAGDTFIVYTKDKTISGYNSVSTYRDNALYKSNADATKTATTTLSATKVATGDLLGVTTSTSAGSSSLGFANTFEYYVLNKTTNKFYKVTLSEGKLNTSAFTDDGEYEVKTVLKDTNGLYVLADSDNFVISNKAKYSVTFGSNDTNMGKVSVSDGTVSYTTSPASVEEGKSVTFTATAENGYKFDGWYSDADCTNPIEGASNATYTVNNISQAVSAYAKFSALSYNITTETVTNYSVVVNESAKYNSKVSVTVTATDNAYEVNGITVTDKDNNVVNVSGGESGVYTFTMPASNVTVKANSKLKQIGAPTVTFNVLGQSTANAKVLGPTVITASYMAAENSTIVEGSENVAVTNADGAEVSADKYNLVKDTATGNYTFTAKEPGAYKLSYTVTAKSNHDESMTVTNSPVSVTITVSYTPTQQAYVDLETYVNTVEGTSAGSYTEDSYAAFSTALTSAQALLTGLPKADATNASDYTNAKTALETAFNGLEKDVTYYISGRFENHDWNTDATDMPFTRVSGESNLYKYETHKSVADLSKKVHNVSGNYDAYQYFFITTGKGLNGTFYTGNSKNGNNFQNNTVAKKLTLTTRPSKDSATESADNLIVFNDINDSSPNVVIYLDTSDKDNLKLYYSTEKYSVTVAEGVPASVDKKTATAGETVTVTATPTSGEVLKSVTVVGADNKSVTTTVSGNNATFKMPAQNVKVTKVTFRAANKYTVNFSSSDDKSGTVSAEYKGAKFTSGTEVTEGDEVTFTAKPNSGYALSDWTVNGTSVSSTTNPYKITVNSNTTVVANFKVEDSGEPSGYYILWGTDASFSKYEAKVLYLKDDGKYYANFDAKTDKIGQNENYYFVFSTSNTTSGVKSEQTNVTINEVTQNKFYFQSNNSDISGVGSTRVPKIWNESADLLGFKIIVSDIDSSNKKVTYSCEPTFDVAPADTVEITAKDGTIRAGYTDIGGKKTTAVLGDTTLSIATPDNKIIEASDSYETDGKNQYRAVTAKKVPNGSTVTVTTTIDPDATFAGHKGSDYYVKGFSVNGIFGGVLSQTDGKNHTSYEYTYTFEVNQEIYGSKLEITPVYFLKNDDNCVYFYIENYDSAKQIWGNTPSCYVYYGSGKTTLEALGYYPGQPMVDYNGSIFTQIPKSIVNGATTEKITGMTLNNYVWDDVHSEYNGKDQKEDNAQTYDYDDFVKIAESGAAADNIIYRFKYNTHDNVPKDTLGTSDTDAAGWEVFLDYQNYPTDIFGNRIGTAKLDYKDTKSVTSKDNYLSIISNGYQNNYIGKYATAWSIYNKAGNRVATIPSSALLYALGKTDEQMTTAIGSKSTPTDFLPGKKDRDTYWKTFKTLYNDYKGFYAQINFEAAITGGDEKGNRLDGRWYYTQSKQKITGEIKIQYANTLDDYNKVGGFQEDTFENASSIVGTTTGASAYFTDPENKVRKLETEADNTQDYKFEVTATPSTAAYTFVGWYRLIDGDYKAINPSNMSSLTGAVTRNSDVTLVARYIKTPGGSMTFQHSLYNGENAGGGKATTEIQVVVKDSDDKPLYDSGRIAGTASIDKDMITKLAVQTGLTVTVTLYTTTKNLYDFKGYYSAENTTVTEPFTEGFTKEVTGNRKEGLVTTSEYTFSFDEYYNTHKSTLIGDKAGTVYYNFYSDITSIKVPYKVQFSYEDREGNQKYYNKAGYVDPENSSTYTIDEDTTVESRPVKVTLTDSFILTLAPYESNFAKDLTWKETPDINNPFNSSVPNSIASAVLNSTQSDKKIYLNVFRDKKTNEPTSRDNKNGDFELYKKNGSPKLPYGSVFYTSNDDGTYTYDITAPKTYEGKQFMYWAIYSDSRCRKEDLVINAYNSEGHFSYVAYDNCWIVPVYGESSTPVASVKDVYTSTQFMEVTRNQWTAGDTISFDGFDADSMKTLDTAEDFIKGDDEDKLYADFVLNFFYNGKQLSVFDPTSSKVQTGIVMQKLKLENDSIGVGYNTDMEHYANEYINDLPAAAEDAKKLILTGKSNIESLTKQINNNRLDNKNRLQYYARFNNTEANVNCVYRVYTYIKYVNESNEPVVKLGDPIYFTLYDVANATV